MGARWTMDGINSYRVTQMFWILDPRFIDSDYLIQYPYDDENTTNDSKFIATSIYNTLQKYDIVPSNAANDRDDVLYILVSIISGWLYLHDRYNQQLSQIQYELVKLVYLGSFWMGRHYDPPQDLEITRNAVI